jgi:hypothetical protein
VDLRLLVQNDGSVEAVCLVNGHTLYVEPAVEAARQWRFASWRPKRGPREYAVASVVFKWPPSGRK